ncbi:HDOD domain-containing protein [Desulfovibrio sp. OttesenSCG-928-F07]|nr:HDOD domain-containing protein [Desulfovibrio sp. OttesenSCG-928-F07]
MANTHINSARDFLNYLASTPIKLPFDPDLLPALFDSMADDSKSSMRDLAELVARSQGLAAKVLSVANSACYGLLTSVTTLERAVQVLGIVDLRSLVIMFSMSESIPQKDLPRGFPSSLLWSHQLRTAKLGRCITATIAEKYPQTQDLPEPDSVYAAGLLHDLGKIILAYRSPQDWQNITQMGDYKGLSKAELEEEYWGIDHGSIGGIVLKDWNLPPILTDMVSWHHYPHFAENNKLAVRILAAANILAEAALGKGTIIPLEVLQALPEFSSMLVDMHEDLGRVISDERTDMFVGLI